jgi:DNA-binding NarL/FixJ family response regulator
MLPKTAAPRIVVLKSDLLYGDLICQQIKEIWRNATVQVFQRGLDALEAIQAVMPDLFITGVKIEDMDGLEHLEPFITRALPILILTSRTDARTFSLLRTIRYDGIYDGLAEGLGNLRKVMERVMAKEHYVSPTFVQHLKKPKSNKRDILTEQEQMILSVIGDGTDNLEAGEKLALSKHTIHSHRKSIMGKLRLHHRGELIIYALQQGYVQVSPNGVYRPGFQRKIRENNGEAKSGGDPVFV